MKTCINCMEVKGLLEFSKRSAAKDGLRTACKFCESKKNKAWSAEHKERRAETNKIWREANKDRVAEYAEANRDRVAAYRLENKDRSAATYKAWQQANKERLAAKNVVRYAENKERITKINKAWQKANPEKQAAHWRNRRARKLASEGSHTASDTSAIFDSQRGLCASCQIKLVKSGKNKYHVDHVMPLKLGGSNWPTNLQCLCPSCNLRKSAKHPDDWAKLNGKLL